MDGYTHPPGDHCGSASLRSASDLAHDLADAEEAPFFDLAADV